MCVRFLDQKITDRKGRHQGAVPEELHNRFLHMITTDPRTLLSVGSTSIHPEEFAPYSMATIISPSTIFTGYEATPQP